MQQPPYDRPPLSTPDGENPNFGNPNADIANTSGQPGAVLPAELQGLNFGAFALNWIWGIAHNYWLGLLCFVPVVGFFMQFYMLFKGNEAAWQSRRFESVAQFREVQHKWMLWGIGVFVLGCIFSILGFIMLAAIGAAVSTQQPGGPPAFNPQ